MGAGRILGVLVITYGIIGVVYWLLEYFTLGWLLRVVNMVWAALVTFVVSGLALVALVKEGLAMFADRGPMPELRAKFDGSRAQIAEALARLRTARSRVAFLRWVDEQQRRREISDKLRAADNAWPSGERPNWGYDRASEYLARLDERWLGLQNRS
jgi:hypothetical protein